MELLLSFLGSLFTVVIVYSVYWLSHKRVSKERAYGECWWLPGWNCFRFVIRNMHDQRNLSGIRYRAWLRRLEGAKKGSSVNTFMDQKLVDGERVLLPGGHDLPVVCFRLERTGDKLKFVQTDKIGAPIFEHTIDESLMGVEIEYIVRIRSWFLFKHEISRTYAIPYRLELGSKEHNLFEEYLLQMQQGPEERVKAVFKTAEEITVTV